MITDSRPIFRQIIAALGPGWTAHADGNPSEPDSNYNKTHMIAQNGVLKLSLYAPDGWPKKDNELYRISGIYARYSDNSCAHRPSDYYSINISRKKTPAQIAREVHRRLLPAYAPKAHEIAEKVQLFTLKEDRQKATEEMIAAALNAPLDEMNTGKRGDRRVRIATYYHSSLPYGKAAVRFNGSVSMELINLDAETAIEIAQIVQAAHRNGQAQMIG